MEKFLKIIFIILSALFFSIGLFLIHSWIFYILFGNAPKCPNIEDGRECWSYIKFLPTLLFSISPLFFYILYKKIINKKL